MDFAPLFEPIDIGPVRVQNRIYQPAHATMFGEGDRNAFFRAEKAKGGFGLIIQEATSVHPSSDYRPTRLGIIFDHSLLGEHEKIVNMVHRHGSRIFLQLSHQGLLTAYFGSIFREPALAPSSIQDPFYGSQAKEMEEEDIEEILDAFADGAQLARLIGYDGVQLHGSHSYLIGEFLQPMYNKRTDRWGGSLENRSRFLKEAAKRIRDQVGGDLAISSRITVDHLKQGGLTKDEGIEVVKMIDNLIDFWDVDVGETGDATSPSRKWYDGFQMEWTRDVRKAVRASSSKKTPVGGVGRIRSPNDALRFLTEGSVDMIGLGRQSIADPHWPRKVKEGRSQEIRTCIQCNTCLSCVYTGRPILCVTNPCAGEEYRGLLPEEFQTAKEKKGILVVGGGPCGLEFARVAGLRGHEVHLFEAAPSVGGHIRMVRQLPGCQEWDHLVSYREASLKKLSNVRLLVNKKAEAQFIDDYGADAIVFATGANWDRQGVNSVTTDPIPGWNLPHVITPEDILLNGKKVSGSVVIFDSDGYLMATGLAELLADQGNNLTVVSCLQQVGQHLVFTREYGVVMKHLSDLGVKLLSANILERITNNSVTIANEWTGRTQEIEADSVVMVTRRVPEANLFQEFKNRVRKGISPAEIHLTGDAVTPKMYFTPMYGGIFWAHRLARDI